MNLAEFHSIFASKDSNFLIYVCCNKEKTQFQIIRLNLISFKFDNIFIETRLDCISLGNDQRLYFLTQNSLSYQVQYLSIVREKMKLRFQGSFKKYYTYDEAIFY